MRTAESFKQFFDLLTILHPKYNVEPPVLPRKRRAPRRVEIGDGDGYHADNIEDYFRAQYFEAIDLAVTGIKDRFDQPGYATYSSLESLLLKAANQSDYSVELEQIVSFYGDDLYKALLEAQLQILSSKYADIPSEVSLKEILDHLRCLSQDQHALLSQVLYLAKLIMVMPASNAASEQSFSTMRKIKTYLRSTMGQERFNNLMILNIYKEELDSIYLISIAKEFLKTNKNYRYRIFGEF